MDIAKALESLPKAYPRHNNLKVIFYSNGSGKIMDYKLGENRVLYLFDSIQEFIDLVGNKIINQS